MLLLQGALLLTACDTQSISGEIPNEMTAETPDENMTMTTAHSAIEHQSIRIATFNVAMGFEQAGELAAGLQNPEHERLRQLAAILQEINPDIVLLNEFDYSPEIDAAGLLNRNFLAVSQKAKAAIEYPFHYRASVNTGIPSGLDIDGNGKSDGPADAWGFGHFPGQYGMLLLSRFPMDAAKVRTFQNFLWADLTNARRPMNPDGSNFYSDETWQQLRLSSKSHWDVPLIINGQILHVLAFHPTPPVFDGPENRNGLRNFDEIHFWANYLQPELSADFMDDQGRTGGLTTHAQFVILGDFNSDPVDGDSEPGACQQLLEHERTNASFVPLSTGAAEASLVQGGVNVNQQGDPAADTADFNDKFTGNLRLDYVLPSADIEILDGGVFWPASKEAGSGLVSVSDHRLVWIDVHIPTQMP